MGSNSPKKRRGLIRILYAIKYSLEGLSATFITEAAFRQEILIACILIPLALMMPLSLVFKAFLIVSTIGVLITELINTAIESTVNMISQDFHPLVKRAKDMGSAAVMLSIINLIVAWIFALFQIF
jgi:diacylglycerol kinase (ATP)